jgi:uncharacterized membrane protein SpoIIM required for sporulation
VTLERFIRERNEQWRRLDELVASAKGRPERLGADGILELGRLYRGAAADLAIARSSFPSDPVRRGLEARVSRAALLLYDTPGRRESLIGFFTDRYWQRIAERPGLVAIAALLLLGSALLAGIWAGNDPDAALGFVPSEFEGAADPPADAGTGPGQEAAFSAFLFTHNIQVSFVCFAAGITAGIGTALLLVNNGLLLGAIGGLAIESGNGATFFDFIVPHGPIELTAIVIASAAGLRIGFALVDPGNRPRSEALRDEGLKAVEMVLGTMPWLVVAGLWEAFVRSNGLPTVVLATVGIGTFAVFWGLVLWRGRAAVRRERGSAEPAPAAAAVRVAPAPSL